MNISQRDTFTYFDSWKMQAILLMLFLNAAVYADRYHPETLERIASVSGRVNAAENSAQYWYDEAFAAIRAREARGAATDKRAKNIVMFLGDGMSVSTITAARIRLGQLAGSTGEQAQLSFEKFPTSGVSKTYCVDAQVPDSSCTATAFLCGVKANHGTMGLTAAVPRRGCNASVDTSTHVRSIAEWALDSGRDVGIVTTTQITDASPAGLYAKVANRGWENNAAVENDGYDTTRCPDIAYQLINMDPGRKFKVILGGGRREFRSDDILDEEDETTGRRTDNRDLIEEWQQDKRNRNMTFAYVWNKDELMQAREYLPDYLLGLFESSDMLYHKEADPAKEPTLTELTEIAIKSLSRNEKGFFLFVEGGRIDHAHHDNLVELALDETIEMHKAVERAAELLPEDDTLMVVTSDHAHVMAFNGYPWRGTPILGPSTMNDRNGVPFMILSYTNGPGFREQINGIRPDVTQDNNFGEFRWRSHTDIPLNTETHGGDDVLVFARGPQHGMFSGLYEQSQIAHLMAYATCIGPGPNVCEKSSANINQVTLLAFLPLTIFWLRL